MEGLRGGEVGLGIQEGVEGEEGEGVGLVLVLRWMVEGESEELKGGGVGLEVWEGVEGVEEVGGGKVSPGV